MDLETMNRHRAGSRTKACVIAASFVLLTQLPASVYGQTGWQPCGANTCAPSGNVGIGTSSPTALLDIRGTLSVGGAPQLYGWQNYNFATGGALAQSGQKAILAYTSGATFLLGTYDYSTGSAPPLSLQGWGGNVGIGTTSPQYKLAVNGTIGTKEVIVTNTGWADYVFKPGYTLRPLREVAAYIRGNQRLPDMPSEAEVREKGVGLADMQVKLLAKIEELTLHMIRLDERNNQLERQNHELREQNVAIREEISKLKLRTVESVRQ